jgi:hypothetical protein
MVLVGKNGFNLVLGTGLHNVRAVTGDNDAGAHSQTIANPLGNANHHGNTTQVRQGLVG